MDTFFRIFVFTFVLLVFSFGQTPISEAGNSCTGSCGEENRSAMEDDNPLGDGGFRGMDTKFFEIFLLNGTLGPSSSQEADEHSGVKHQKKSVKAGRRSGTIPPTEYDIATTEDRRGEPGKAGS